MATGGEKKADDFHFQFHHDACSLCMESYVDGKTPKLLPCFHTFCLPCLTELAKKATKPETDDQKVDCEKEELGTLSESKTESGCGNEAEAEPLKLENVDENHHGDTFLCPTCRATVVIPDGGVSALQTNFYLHIESANTESSESTLCQVCEEGNEKGASHYCQECEQRMCPDCRRCHDRLKKLENHHLVEFGANKSFLYGIKRPFDKRLCQHHSDQALCFHCRKCNTSICLHCKLTAHENHETEDMSTAANRAKEELAGVLEKAKQQVKSLNACLSHLEMDKYDLRHEKQELEQQINSRHQVIEIWAARAREEIMQRLATKAEASLVEISSETTSASVAKEMLMEAITKSNASAKATYGPDIVFLKNELEAALLNDGAEAHFSELASHKEQKNFFSCASDSSILNTDLMRMFIGEMRESNSLDSTHAVNLQDIVSKMITLEKELKDVTDCVTTGQIASNMAALESNLKEVKDCVTTGQIASKITALERNLKDLTGVVNTEKITTMTRLKEVAAMTQAAKVVFHAFRAHESFCPKDCAIIFDIATCHPETSYNSSFGIFCAPEDGTYIFMATLGCKNLDTNSAVLKINNVAKASVTPPRISTMHVTASLKKGDCACVVAGKEGCSLNGDCSFFTGAKI